MRGLRGAVEGICVVDGGSDGAEGSVTEALASVGGVVVIIVAIAASLRGIACGICSIAGGAIVDVDMVALASSGNSAGGGYFWKKRSSCGGSDLATCMCWALIVVCMSCCGLDLQVVEPIDFWDGNFCAKTEP